MAVTVSLPGYPSSSDQFRCKRMLARYCAKLLPDDDGPHPIGICARSTNL
ncbi:MAG: hypothetical protein JXA96_06420 [Sedimentisphaerales bacterium]|nr:hypothetical protein [Sedimentisphaerales bacterium]